MTYAEDSFESFCNRYYSSVFDYVRRRVASIEDAEDLTNEIFLTCMLHFGDYDPLRGAHSTWLFAVVRSRLCNYYRSLRFNVSLDTLQSPAAGDDVDWQLVLMREQLSDALAQLPENQRNIVQMRYFGGYSAKEIGKHCDMTPSNVRVNLSRALRKMQTYLQEDTALF